MSERPCEYEHEFSTPSVYVNNEGELVETEEAQAVEQHVHEPDSGQYWIVITNGARHGVFSYPLSSNGKGYGLFYESIRPDEHVVNFGLGRHARSRALNWYADNVNEFDTEPLPALQNSPAQKIIPGASDDAQGSA